MSKKDILKSSLGVIGAGIGAYNMLNPIEDVEQYESQAQQLGNSNYQLGSLQGLAEQYANRNVPQTLTGNDLYNPTAGQRFAQMFGSGLMGYQATSNLTDNFDFSKMGSTFIQGSSGYNTASGKGWGELGNAVEEQASLGRDFSGPEGTNMLMQEFNVKGAKYDLEGIMLNNGSMVKGAIDLTGAGLTMGINAIGNTVRRNQAAIDAERFNALRDFSISRNNLDLQRAITDSSDNMFNLQALQMKAEGGNIYIKPSKRGTFTEAAKKRGMGVQEFASKVLANKDDYSTAMVKKANFARNAAKWHAMGGPLSSYGTDWTTGLNVVGNGGTHEQNPFEGVPMGIAPDGQPNLVEQDETILNGEYVFSDRLKISKKMLDKYNLPAKYEGKSYAEVSKELNKEFEERPNDPISKKGADDSMSKLRMAQEEYKAERDYAKMQKQFGKGGTLMHKYEGEEEPTQKMEFMPQSLLRYAPTIASGIAALSSINDVDYTNPNLIGANTRYINFTPIGDYLTLQRTPVATTIANKMQAQQAATNAAIMNTAANRAAAIPSLLTAGYQGQTALSDAYLKAVEQDNAIREKEAIFNKDTNQTNMQAKATIDRYNQEMAYQSAVQQATMREAIDRYISEARSANLSSFLTDLSAIGKEALDRKSAEEVAAASAANGGKLNKRKRKGLTY